MEVKRGGGVVVHRGIDDAVFKLQLFGGAGIKINVAHLLVQLLLTRHVGADDGGDVIIVGADDGGDVGGDVGGMETKDGCRDGDAVSIVETTVGGKVSVCCASAIGVAWVGTSVGESDS